VKLGFNLIRIVRHRFGGSDVDASRKFNITDHTGFSPGVEPRSLGSFIDVADGLRLRVISDRYRFFAPNGGLPAEEWWWLFRSSDSRGARWGGDRSTGSTTGKRIAADGG